MREPRLTLSTFPGRTCQGGGCNAAAVLIWEDYSQRVRLGDFDLLCPACVAARFAVEYALAAAVDRAVRLGVAQRQADSAEAYAHVSGLIGETLTVIEELTGPAYDRVASAIHFAVGKAIRFARPGVEEARPERERAEAAAYGIVIARHCTGLTVLHH